MTGQKSVLRFFARDYHRPKQRIWMLFFVKRFTIKTVLKLLLNKREKKT